MTMPEYITTAQAVEFLKQNGSPKMNLNNFYQITNRFKRMHKLLNHKDDGPCICVVVERKNKGESYYRKDKVVAYSLYSKGDQSDVGKIIAKAREANKELRVGKTKGKPTNKVRK